MDAVMLVFSTTWGWVGISAGSRGLLATTLPKNSRREALDALLRQCPLAQEGLAPLLEALRQRLERYFLGQRVGFCDEVLDTHRATGFESRVWEVVRKIPFGQVRSYGWVAAQAGSPQAARAVGRAMAVNPMPIVIPCHRVVGHKGQLTGFGGGLAMKRRLLDLEAGQGTWQLQGTRPTLTSAA